MDSNVTSPQSEPDQDNSSLLNPSTNPAEAGTTDETRDEDHETSSIEALNWSEVEEEELAAAQKAEALANAAAGATLLSQDKSENKAETKIDKDDENTTKDGSSAGNSTVVINDEGNVLSTTLLQSINSTASDEDPKARKLSVIENWASEVTNAVERGEIELEGDFPDDNGVTGDDEDDTEAEVDAEGNNEGVRKRKVKKLTPEMVSSMMSSGSSTDPLSNAPVLDDGPIWNKGPRSYTFQENRRINQKLTFCLLIAVVLAIGLGLGNLVAHQECEAEFKASQQSQHHHHAKAPEKSPIHAGTIPTTTTPSPIIPDRSTDSTLPNKRAFIPTTTTTDSTKQIIPDENESDDHSFSSTEKPMLMEETKEPQIIPPKKRVEPIIDPKYRVHAETLSKVVHTLDRLSQKIDKFENNTRKLQGVLMIPDEEETESDTSSLLYDERIHHDDGDLNMELPLDGKEDEAEREADEVLLDGLIDAIEQTPDYVEMKEAEESLERSRREKKEEKSIFAEDIEESEADKEERLDSVRLIEKTFQQIKEFQRRFVKNERKRLREAGKYNRLKWRLPQEYTIEERSVLRARYKESWQKFIDLAKDKVADPVHVIFGDEEDEEERTYEDVFYYPFSTEPNPDLTNQGRDLEFEKKPVDSGFNERIKKKREDEEDILDIDLDLNIPISNAVETDGETTLEDVQNVQPESSASDDLIILETVASAKPEETKNIVHKKEDVKVGKKSSSPKRTEDTASTSQNPAGKFDSVDPIVNVDSSKTLVRSQPPPSPDNTSDNGNEQLSTSEKDAKIDNRSSVRTKRDAPPNKTLPTLPKAKKQGEKSVSNSDSTGKKFQAQAATNKVDTGKSGKRDQKVAKEQKVRQGKQKTNTKINNNNGSSGDGQVKSEKAWSKASKKIKNFESNKVFENVKGKQNEKRRSPPVVPGPGPGKENQVPNKRSSSPVTGESGYVKNSKTSSKSNGARNDMRNGNGQQQQRQQNTGKENRSPSKMKHESHEFPSSKETVQQQHRDRQRRNEFNANYVNSQGQGKKSNWQKDKGKSKVKRATSAGI